MNDQANILRQLVLQEAASRRPRAADAALIVVAAGKGGVGTTTVAANLALALARGGRGCVLVDGNPHSADATTLCGLDAQFGISHVVAGWRNVEETLLAGPGNIQLLPGVWDREYDDQWTELAQSRLIKELRALGRRAGFVVVDAGCGLGSILGRFWRAADIVLMVTTPEPLAIMDAYAAIKVHAEGARTPVHVLVNRATDTQQAADAQQRVSRVCHRFLGLTIHDAGYLPILPSSAGRTAQDDLFVLQAPESTAARYVDRLAQTMAQPATLARRASETLARRASEGGSGESTTNPSASLASASG
jgi:flagellar biosynthesis protein FlhG